VVPLCAAATPALAGTSARTVSQIQKKRVVIVDIYLATARNHALL
jgi:hypothetical protein